jgi:Na+-driven multidrug efflux pump
VKQLHIYKDKLISMIRIGLPAGLQGALFNVSNVLIQSSVNSFGSVAMAGNSASANIEGFIYMGMNAIYQTVLSFISQNLGAKQYKRITRVAVTGVGLVAIIGVVLGGLALLCDTQLLSIYSDTADVVTFGLKRMWIIAPTYFICGMMDVIMGCNRGLGYSIMPMIVSLAGACGFAVLAYIVNNIFSFQQALSAVTVFMVLGMGEAFVRKKSQM